jgi:protein tyrosine phosphatase (PTP) superfamily phosphohydrolase (DUF442 family)
MTRWKRSLLWLIFFGSFGFAGGGAFLLFGLVPLERHLTTSGWSQHEIDQTFSFLVFSWFLFALLVSGLYSRFTLQVARPLAALSLAGVMAMAAGFVFYEFLHAESLMLAGRSAKIEEVSQRLSFGPYPDKDQLKLLKEQGYDGVISLLHPAIPFEEVLLQEEKANGEALGLRVYSFPMLPWISENKAALAGIRALIQQPGQRYYVHCYLGQHRANLVRRMAGYGVSGEAAESDELPDRLERGLLFSYEEQRIVVGPFPSDEEWFGIILRHGVREVVSTLDPEDSEESKLLGKTRKIGQDYALTVTERPLDKDSPDSRAVRRLADYLKKSDHRIYVLGHHTDNWARALDRALGGREEASLSAITQDTFERGPLLKVNESVVLGPYPTDAEVEVLRRAGVRAVVSLLDDDQSEWINKEAKWAEENHFVFKRFPLKPGQVTRAKLEDISVYLFNQPGLTYVHSFRTDNNVRDLYKTMRRMISE